jgi:hypothetical protein
MGDDPSHPELLDWLATEFMRDGWSRKAVIRQLVTSAAYRQSSNIRPEVESRDPENMLLARQSRFRVEGEVVRDLYLAASGLLYETIGGPSVRPELPRSVAELSYASNMKWPVSEAPLCHRRGVYIVLQRTVPYPSLVTFDCPDGLLTSARRNESNTPLQALTTLNDPMFFECAQALGGRLLHSECGDDNERLRLAGRITLGRELSGSEVARLSELLAEETSRFAQRPEAALQYAGIAKEEGGGPAASSAEGSRTAAWISVASALLNLDEFLTRE